MSGFPSPSPIKIPRSNPRVFILRRSRLFKLLEQILDMPLWGIKAPSSQLDILLLEVSGGFTPWRKIFEDP